MDYGHPLILGVRLHNDSLPMARELEDLGYAYMDVSLLPEAESAADQNDGIQNDGIQNTGDVAARLPELDSWTAGTWVAGTTRRARIRSSVDLSQGHFPTVVARAAASSDLLSGGRTELLLQHSPNSAGAQDAHNTEHPLVEAAHIIRGMWNAESQQPLHFTGTHYTVPGASRGPAPAHAVALWMSGNSKHVRAAVAADGDGWLYDATERDQENPDGNAAPNKDDLVALNNDLDGYIVGAARDPREVRRQIVLAPAALPGVSAHAPKETIAYLLGLVGAGFSEFIFDTSSTQILEFLAEHVKPELFAQLARTRTTTGTSTGVLKSARIRSQRTSRIDYDSIPQELKDIAVEPGDPHYAAVQNTYLRGGKPGVVLRARSTADVQASVRWAHTQEVEFSIRSGGHGFSGRSTNRGGIVLDLRSLRSIEVLDAQSGMVRIGPGAQWAEVAAALEPHGLAISSGDSGSVGVGGLATVGGLGFFAKEHGLTIDYVRELEIVTASGEVVVASAEQNPELFWGMRGAGPNFGVVTAFVFQARRVGLLAHVQLAYQVDDLEEFLVKYGQMVEAAPRDTTLFLMAGRPQNGRPLIVQLYGIVDNSDPDTVLERLAPFATLSPLVGQQVYMTTYSTAIGEPSSGPQHGQGEPIARSGALEHITPGFAQAASDLIYSGETFFFQIRTAGGAVADVPEDATAFAFRSATFHVLAMGSNRARLNHAWDGLGQYFDGFYPNFETDTSERRVQQGFSTGSWKRLKALKKQWDPTNFFNDNFNISPN